MKEIIIATKNKGKAKEFEEFFKPHGIRTISLLDFVEEPQDIEETGVTFKENAALKAETMSNELNKPVLADDSGLIIDALDGRPGIFSARYAGEPKNDQANIEKVLNELRDVTEKNRTARFICVIAIAQPDQQTIFKTGYCEGHISFSETGTHGFGYDPIFIPEGYTNSMAELTSDEKNLISHRSHAIKQLEQWIQRDADK
ncbi:XTP/dITP diphosphatase [Virgibacillus sp. MSJ-26]|uniref:XTP/dITP diphosphatase n=1 Tax=Virgibacillus sp. MSJ-26 TaxID=2841522 RepID=UPI001C122BA8|nr:XTP/dITP diphosphatase [Virgibacillus sp. MSJ-26]MBU5466544.1 XTP/dITP diphosphatase [Virgibacillus sp. MSJ-26]